MVHWAQGVRRKVEDQPKFAKYDYGHACADAFGNAQPCNQDMYGSEEPPVYDLKAIETPVAIFSGMVLCCCCCCYAWCSSSGTLYNALDWGCR